MHVPGPPSGGPAILLPASASIDRPFADLLGISLQDEPAPRMPFAGVHLTASDYLKPHCEAAGLPFRPQVIWADLLSQHPRDDLLIALSLLNHGVTDPVLGAVLRTTFLSSIAQDLSAHATTALEGGLDGESRHFLSRALILRTMRAVLSSASNDRAEMAAGRQKIGMPPAAMDLIAVAIVMTHLAADAMGANASPTEPYLGGLPRSLAMEIVQNELFHQRSDVGDLLGRTALLWRPPYLDQVVPPPRLPPEEMLHEATGVPLDYLAATAFALLARTLEYAPNRPTVMPTDALPPGLALHLDAALRVLARTPEELAASFAGMAQDWQMLPLQDHPVLRLPTGLVILDEAYLMERVTTGLFWVVHDHEKTRPDPAAVNRWRGSYANLFERLAVSRVFAHAPAVIGGTATFTEADLKRAYPGPGKKHIDAGIDFGSMVLLAEVVSGQVSVPTRTTGDIAAFENDLERLVYKKVRQLHENAERLLANPPDFIGHPIQQILPTIVQGGQFPHNRVTQRIVSDFLLDNNLLQHSRIRPLVILGLDDLELAEILQEREHTTLPHLIEAWLVSDYAETSLRNYLLATHDLSAGIQRLSQRKAELEGLFEPVTALLGVDMPL